MEIRRSGALGVAAFATALVLVGCTAPGSDTAPTEGSEAVTADLAAAEAYLAPYQASEKSLVIDEPLAQPLPTGLNIAFLDVGTPVAGAMWDLLLPAVDLTGITLTREPIGSTPESQDAALAAIADKDYDGIINVTAEPIFFPNQVQKFIDAGIPFVSASIMRGDEFDIPTVFNGAEFHTEIGRVMAASAIVRTNGEATEFVFYPVNEFEFTQFQRDGFMEKMAELCPECTVRDVGIPITDVIAQDNSRIVSDLQANPQTEYYALSADEMAVGLPGRLELAGVTVKGLGSWSIPPNIRQVADGLSDATFAEDFGLFIFTVADQLFREITDTPYSWPAPSQSAPSMTTLITIDNAAQFPDGYVAIPDYMEQYAALWGVG